MRYQYRLVLLAVVLCALQPVFSLPIRVLATGDMHGWMVGQQQDGQVLGGAAEMLAHWKQVENYESAKFLVLGCGDFNSGPALATAFKGDPMVSVMNLMGYDACTLGNHEFDYGSERFAHWVSLMKFPLLAANIERADGKPIDPVLPYMLYEEQGIPVGIIGLVPTDLHILTNNAGAFSVSAYALALRKVVPEIRAKGAKVLIVAAHVPQKDLVQVAKQVSDLDIPLMLGAHSHELDQIKTGNTWIVNSGEWWQAYSRVDLDYNEKSGKAVVVSAKQTWLLQRNPAVDTAVANEIARWQRQMDAEYTAPIGYTATGLQRPHAVYNLVCDSFLASDATADIALTNYGSMRQDIPAGPVSKGTIMGVMPFTNALYRLTLTGEQLLAVLPKRGGIGMAGLVWKTEKYLLVKTGQPIDPAAKYAVIMTNYMYDVIPSVKAADPAPKILSEDWRQPVYDWLIAHPSSKEKPLETMADLQARIQ